MKSICGTSLKGAVVAAALLALLVLPTAPQSYAAEKDQKQQGTTSGTEQQEFSLDYAIQKRVAEGFSVIGPLVLQGASRSELVIAEPEGQSPVTVSLKKKTVTVQDHLGNTLTTGSVQKGSNVIICQKKDSVVIYILPKKESGDAKNR